MTKNVSIVTLGVMFATLLFPCRAQQASVEQLKATAASLTAESAKRGENATFQVCGSNNRYGLCITFPGADASDFAEKIYNNSDFAKDMARQGFAAVVIRNRTTDKTLSQTYTMNVTEEGWAVYGGDIHDPAEDIAAMLAENQNDPTKKVIALRTFVQRYPNSVATEGILDRLMIAQTDTGDNEGSIATAKQLLAIVDASDPTRVQALWELVRLSMVEAKAGTNTDENLRHANEYSEMGMRALEQVKRPAYMSEEQFATFKSNATAVFEGMIGANNTHSASVSEDPALMNSLAQQTIEVVDSQPGPGNTWVVNARITGENITVVLFCSNDVAEYCGPLDPKLGKLDATLLRAGDQVAYKHYPTWDLQYPMANRSFSFYAVYKTRDSQGYSHEGRYPDKSAAKPQFSENGGAGLYLDMDHLQSQDKTDEQAVCLEFIQMHEPGEYNLPNYLAVPTVDCYDHITYTHVILTNSDEMGKAVRGIILRDNRPGSCGSGGCAMHLVYQGGPYNPGDEHCQYCKNAWSPGIDAVGTDMKVTTVDHQGWYDVTVTRRRQSGTSVVEQSTYRRAGPGLYHDVAAIAKAQKEAAEGAALRRSVALSLGLHSTQSQAVVKAILSAHGYSRLEDGTGQTGPWNCTSDGWKGGQWTTSCISQKGDVKIGFLFELGRMYRNPDTGAVQQVRTDHLLFASFEFEKYDFPDNTLKLVSPTLKKCNGEDDGDGVCLNF